MSSFDDVPAAAGVHGAPVEDMCCLCTMEDITLEDGNYGRSYLAAGLAFRSIVLTFEPSPSHVSALSGCPGSQTALKLLPIANPFCTND
jgi:hypothetical protein